jgi:pimeloyl-ACP methyl ester carboxylesterase
VPFRSRAAAIEHFGGPSLSAEAWAAGLEERDDGWWPRFEVDVMVRTLREAVARDHWHEWESIRCPTLVVRAGDGNIPLADAEAMVERLPNARLVELPGAAHDLHLDQPAAWREAVLSWLVS